MPPLPDDRFPLPAATGPGSVWADRVGHRRFVGRNQRGVEIPIGAGDGEINPGELLKLALIGCAGMSSDFGIGRRLGDDFPMRLWVHGESDEATNRYESIDEEIQLDLSDLSEAQVAKLHAVIDRAVAAGCTVERTVGPGVEVHHRISDTAVLAVDTDPSTAPQQGGAA